MKVVFDTNVFVSAFIVPGGKGEEALLLALRRKVDLFTSVPISTETTRIPSEPNSTSLNEISWRH